MAREVILFSSEERQNRKSVSEFLHQLAEKIAGGQVVLRQGGEEFELTIPENIVLEIKVEEEVKKTKVQRSLEVEIEWIVGDESSSGVSLG